jgi:hypothetical protein
MVNEAQVTGSFDPDDTLAEVSQVARLCLANILVVGQLTPSYRERIVATVATARRREVFLAQHSQQLTLPDNHQLLTVLDDVSRLTDHEQFQLLQWMDEHRPQLVSFTPTPIFPLVCKRRFLDTLFYRLNVVTFPFPSPE